MSEEYYFEDSDDDDDTWDLYCGDVYIGVLEYFDDNAFVFTDYFGKQYQLEEVIDDEDARDAVIDLIASMTIH